MAERPADEWAEIFPESHREALLTSMCMLIDDFFGQSGHSESLLASYLIVIPGRRDMAHRTP